MSPGKPIDENGIKTKLVSDDPEERRAGFDDVVEAYREPLWGRLSGWSKNRRWGLGADEIGDCVQDTMFVLWRLVRASKFKFDGRLSALLGTIAYRRGVDRLRKRSRMEFYEDPSILMDESLPYLDAELIEEFKICLEQMKEIYRIVVSTFIDLRIDVHPEKVTPMELTLEVNKRYKLSLEESTVKSRLDRGRGEFRELLEKRGRDE